MRDKLKIVLLTLFLLLLPTQLGKHFFFDFSYVKGVRIDYLAFAVYFTDILVIALSLLYRKPVALSVRRNKRVILYLFPLIMLNVAISRYPIIALYRVAKIIELYIVFIIFKSPILKTRIFHSMLLIAGTVELLLSTAQLYTKASLQGVFYFLGERALTISQPDVAKAALSGIQFLRPYGTFSHPNSMAGFYLLIYTFVLYSFRVIPDPIRDPYNKKRFPIKLGMINLLLRNGLLLVSAILILISFSKIAIGTFVFINFVYLATRHKKISCVPCVIASAITILAVALVFLQAHGDPLSFEKRMVLLSQGVEIFQKNFLFGTGLGHYLYFQSTFPSQYPYFFLQPVHNIFVLFFAQTGLLLGGAIIYTIIKSFWRMRKSILFLACLSVILITGSLDHYWLTLQQNLLLLGVIFGSTTRKTS